MTLSEKAAYDFMFSTLSLPAQCPPISLGIDFELVVTLQQVLNLLPVILLGSNAQEIHI